MKEMKGLERIMKSAALVVFVGFGVTAVSAQERDADAKTCFTAEGYAITLSAGYNLGGVLPLPIPGEIKSINSYSPGMHFVLGIEVERVFVGGWGLMTGVRFETKGMKAGATVENYRTRLNRNGDWLEGNYTGEEKTRVSHTLVTVPLLVRCRLGGRFAMGVGPYVAYAMEREFSGEAANGYMRTLKPDPVTGEMVPIGDKVEIPRDKPATYDFSEELRHVLWGVEFGADWQCARHFKVQARLDWGLNDVFKSGFKETIAFPMYPVFATFGFGYTF